MNVFCQLAVMDLSTRAFPVVRDIAPPVPVHQHSRLSRDYVDRIDGSPFHIKDAAGVAAFPDLLPLAVVDTIRCVVGLWLALARVIGCIQPSHY